MKRVGRQVDRVPDLLLPRTVVDECDRLMAAVRPREACALLVGERTDAGHEVLRLAPIPNLAGDVDTFRLDPRSWRKVELDARVEGLEVLGVWHSHPRTEATPSPRDQAGAQPGWSHAISAAAGPVRLKSYFPSEGRLVEQKVVTCVPVAQPRSANRC